MIPFGPIPSRRLGHSLGINHLPAPKHCSVSCVYCQLGPTDSTRLQRRTFFPPEHVASEVGERVAELRARGEPIDYLSFVPDGEPTLDANLGAMIEMLRPLGVPIAVITNASLIDLEEVRQDLAKADLVSLKVDAVRETGWRAVNRPDPRLELPGLLDGMRQFARDFAGDLLTETMLVSGLNDGEADLEATARFVGELQPRTAFIAVPTRPTAESWCRPADEKAVARAYALFRRRLRSVECLTGFDPEPYGSTGQPLSDLLGILAIHPMRESEVREFLHRSATDPSILEQLIQQGEVQSVEYQDQNFYVRRMARGGVPRHLRPGSA